MQAFGLSHRGSGNTEQHRSVRFKTRLVKNRSSPSLTVSACASAALIVAAAAAESAPDVNSEDDDEGASVSVSDARVDVDGGDVELLSGADAVTVVTPSTSQSRSCLLRREGPRSLGSCW